MERSTKAQFQGSDLKKLRVIIVTEDGGTSLSFSVSFQLFFLFKLHHCSLFIIFFVVR